MSRLVSKTQREIPAEADTISHQLLIRAGMIQQVTTGVYSYLPLARRVLNKIENIIRQEMDEAGGQEVVMPILQPLEWWQESGRAEGFGKTLFIVTDRRDRKLVLGPTHEEVVTKLVGRHVRSYRDLPQMVYQIQTKLRDEPRSRGGILRVREFIMKDLYSFDVDEKGLDVSYNKMLHAYERINERCGLRYMMVEADSGAIGGKDSHEFMVIADSGEDELINCPKCHYAANVEKATGVKAPAANEPPLPLEEIATPGAATIERVAGFLKVPSSQTLKAVFYVIDGQIVFVVIRGDIEVNEVKLQRLLHSGEPRMATHAELAEAGIVAGAASPVGLKGVRIIADESVTTGTNFVAGANKPETHLKNVNYPRDFKADIIADIAKARVGDSCPKCGAQLESTRGIEMGHIFKLGTSISEKLGATFLDADGSTRTMIMGCYGIGVGRILAAAIEQSHDDKGIIWPMAIAPYQVHLCALYMENPQISELADKLYADLTAQEIEVLYDDRAESPGVKFNDADLLGMPLRITVSPRNLEKNSVELKWRNDKKAQLLPLEGIVGVVKGMVEGRR